MVVSDAIAVATSLWVVFTYLVEIAVHAPKLLLHFPKKDAGKSTALGVLHWLVQRPYAAVEATGAAAYRIIDQLKPTLLLDEADTLFRRNTALAHIINSSWTNSGQTIPRVGPRGTVVGYNPYSVQAIAMKGLNMPGPTLSRCVTCMIWPKLPSETVEDFNYTDDEEFRTIRSKLLRWVLDNAATLRDANPESAPGFSNRIKMNWKLLLAIADRAGGAWPKRARAAALELYSESNNESDDDVDVRAFAVVEQLLHGREELTSAEVCAAMTEEPTSEWCNFRGKGPISQTQLAALFRPYGIYTVKLSKGRGYRRAQFKQPFARLLRKTTKEPENRKQPKTK
jgi:putative DNA primase/helicase